MVRCKGCLQVVKAMLSQCSCLAKLPKNSKEYNAHNFGFWVLASQQKCSLVSSQTVRLKTKIKVFSSYKFNQYIANANQQIRQPPKCDTWFQCLAQLPLSMLTWSRRLQAWSQSAWSFGFFGNRWNEASLGDGQDATAQIFFFRPIVVLWKVLENFMIFLQNWKH